MAKITRIQPQYTITLELSRDEARLVQTLLALVSGQGPNNELAFEMREKLLKSTLETDFPAFCTPGGFIRFSGE